MDIEGAVTWDDIARFLLFVFFVWSAYRFGRIYEREEWESGRNGRITQMERERREE